MNQIHVLDKKVVLKQPENGFRTSLDTIMLAASCQIKPGQSLLDAGCGVGAAGLCVVSRCPDAHLQGVDIDEYFISLARENAALNGHNADQASFSCQSIEIFKKHDKPIFDHVICNPPYMSAGAYAVSPHPKKAIALGHHDTGPDLKAWIKALHRVLKPQGSLCMVHRADMVDQIIQHMAGKFGALEIIPLWPKVGMPAKRVIIRARKDRKDPCKMHPGVVLHQDNGEYSDTAEDILRGRAVIK